MLNVSSSMLSQVELPGPRVHVPLPYGLSDKELFERFCLPEMTADVWDDVHWLNIGENVVFNFNFCWPYRDKFYVSMCPCILIRLIST